MPSSTRSNKETELIFSSDPASMERSIHKRRRSSSIDNNNSSSLDSRQPPSIQTLSSTDTHSPPSTEDRLPSTDIFHLISIDTPVRTSIDTEPRDMRNSLAPILSHLRHLVPNHKVALSCFEDVLPTAELLGSSN
ncbi:hypothetical protein F2Q68_00009747 [Brassica cretica]|uniref:Uncharacterized protein n=1 Tax=Brassica cretica TaxID=69181 RepID=A0A3N6PXI5_BRACR|nr:hypothetical protein F2Q68_00009747 [Brassica cretica]